jgi:hypothetical protein
VQAGERLESRNILSYPSISKLGAALHPKMHITTPNAKIVNYADNQMQVRGGILIGIWDEVELAAIRARIAAQSAQ